MHQSTQISYEVHDAFTGLLSVVNNFIQQKDDEDFIGTWMMIASFEAPENGFVLNKVMLHLTKEQEEEYCHMVHTSMLHFRPILSKELLLPMATNHMRCSPTNVELCTAMESEQMEP